MTGREVFLNEKNLLSLRIKNKKEKDVSWYNLSKGEKTLLCLLLVAYLHNDENNVFLLDEPDLSLHIQWQKQLIKSLVTLAPKSQFIISTHSPALIGHVEHETIINVGLLLKK
jgi:predicted ATPase